MYGWVCGAGVVEWVGRATVGRPGIGRAGTVDRAEAGRAGIERRCPGRVGGRGVRGGSVKIGLKIQLKILGRLEFACEFRRSFPAGPKELLGASAPA